MKDSRVQERVGPISDRVRKPLVATGGPPRAVVFFARAWRERPGERFDAAALNVDDRHCGHANHRVLDQSMPDCLRPVFLAADVERSADIVAPGVARGRLLCQRL